MAPEIQEDDVVLVRSLQPTHELPQFILMHLSEARLSIIDAKFPVGPAAGICSQVQLTRKQLTGVKRKPQIFFEGHGVLIHADAKYTSNVVMSTPSSE